MTIIDISPTLVPGLPVWPGDPEYRIERCLSMDEGDPVNLHSISLSLHAGSHIDAPAHCLQGGATVDEVSLASCIGPARLVRVDNHLGELQPEHFSEVLRSPVERLLIACDRDPGCFPQAYPFLGVRTAQMLVDLGICLVGTDAPSVDAFEDDSLSAHRVLLKGRIVILENLNLVQVPDGDYELIALPLPVKGGEAAPVRAILRRA